MQRPGSSLRLVRQLELGDCGAACLTTVLRAQGCVVDLPVLRDLTSTGRDGVSARGLVTAARSLGFDGTGVRCPVDRLDELPAGAVLHWSGNHFVVLLGRSRRGVQVLDPALGRRTVAPSTLQQEYSGVALLFAPGDAPGITTLDPEQSTSRWSRYRPFLDGARRPAALALLFAAVVQAFALVTPLVLRRVVDAAQNPAPETISTLAAAVVVLASAFLLAQVARLLCLVALQRLVDVRLTLGVLQHLAALPYSFLARRSTGDLALRVRSTVAVRQILTSGALSAALDGALVLGYLAVIAVIDVPFALLTALAIGAQAAVVAGAWPPLRQVAAEALEAQSRSQSQLLELLTGFQLLKASGAAGSAVTQWSQRLHREVGAQAQSSRLNGLVDSVLLTLRFAAPSALLVLGLARLAEGALSLGDMLALAALSAAVTVPVGALLGTVCSLASVAGYLERLDDLLQATPEPRGTQPAPDRLTGAVRLESVTYSYSALLPPALEDVSVDLQPGEHVAVVGASGCGKTTLAMLLATLYAPTSGRVLLDGLDTGDYDPDELRRRIGVVTQETTLFSGSVRDNIVFGRPWIAEQDVVAAAERAQIARDVQRLPSGYGTLLGNGGSGLSGGQRQRLALARALAGDPGLLVLDEATSALDPVTERAVHTALAELGCTRVVVAHRLSTVTAADRVLVLDDGRLVDDGSYAAVRQSSSAFRALLRADGRTRSADPATPQTGRHR